MTVGPRSGDMSGDWEFLLPAEARGKIACRSVTILSAYANFETMGRNWPVIVLAVSSLLISTNRTSLIWRTFSDRRRVRCESKNQRTPSRSTASPSWLDAAVINRAAVKSAIHVPGGT